VVEGQEEAVKGGGHGIYTCRSVAMGESGGLCVYNSIIRTGG
jgi:hypothetical protein